MGNVDPHIKIYLLMAAYTPGNQIKSNSNEGKWNKSWSQVTNLNIKIKCLLFILFEMPKFKYLISKTLTNESYKKKIR